jgi:hypothetical protein
MKQHWAVKRAAAVKKTGRKKRGAKKAAFEAPQRWDGRRRSGTEFIRRNADGCPD